MRGGPVVVVGGVVAGTAAARATKRQAPEAEVILLERSPFVSYVADALPYQVAGPLSPLERVVIASAADFQPHDGVELRIGHEVETLDVSTRVLVVRTDKGRSYDLPYASLVLATGARLEEGQLEGLPLEGVFAPRQLQDAIALRKFLTEERPESALIIGAGKNGFALAESLRGLDLEVTVLERELRALGGFCDDTSRRFAREAERRGVALHTGQEVRRLAREGGCVVVQTTSGARFGADVVVLATGLSPVVDLAVAAGLRLGASGALEVDHQLHTSAPGVFAAGECAEAFHRVSRRHVFHPLPTTAFKQGDVAGANAAGAHRAFPGIVGTLALRFFDVEAARTGLSAGELERLGDRVVPVVSEQRSSGRLGDTTPPIATVVYAERGSGRLLGAEMCGIGTVIKRVDVFAAALHAEMTVADVASLDLAWTPQVSPVLDPVLVGASAARDKTGALRSGAGGGEAFTPDV
jgi:CoA-dependent NAD(P)H sulfur oxidoreductase